MRKDVRIVLAGDANVGKSTLITSLIKEQYVARVQKVLPEITLPVEVAPEGVVTKISDTSSSPEKRSHMESELRRANVICIVYSIEAPASFDRIPNYWLPYLRSLGINVPVILVGNKIDLRSGDVTNKALEEELAPIMTEFKEVETCVECSAKIPLNVSEVFYFAQKAVLYPTAPLYDSRSHALKPACVEALKRIFKLCDMDKDGLLNDYELNDFQRRCFDAPLQAQELEGIKDVVADGAREIGWSPEGNGSDPGLHNGGNGDYFGRASSSSDGGHSSYYDNPHLRDNGLTLAGFLYLHTLFIRRGRLETTWTALRTFGYGSDLALVDSFVHPPFHVSADCSVELSPHGYQFLTDIFEVHDKDHDSALSDEELANLFSTAPGNAHPWKGTGFPQETTITNEHGSVTLQGWLAQWSMTTLLDYRTTLAYMAYLGYPSFSALGMHVSTSTPPSLQSPVDELPGARRAGGDNTGAANGNGYGGHSNSSTAKGMNTLGASSPAPIFLRRKGKDALPHPDTTSALKVTNPRRADRKKKGRVQRNVFLALVFGGAGSGKTSLLRAMIGKRFSFEYEPTGIPISAVSAVEHAGAEKYLVLQEYGSHNEAEALRSTAKLNAADVIVYVYDSSDTNSFSHISNLRQKHSSSTLSYGYLLSGIPCLFVATKADLDLAVQRHEVQPDVYCRKLGIAIPGLGAGPLNVSVRMDQLAELFQRIVGIAVDSRGAVPGGRRADGALTGLTRGRWWLYVLFGVVCSTGGVLFVAKRYGSVHVRGIGLSASGSLPSAGGSTSSAGTPGAGAAWLGALWGNVAGGKREL
ncbi:mitochondrial Rho GTPase 1 [Tilletiaria anomala UBC 951]|uniref:Mitochondrial Rho GTPase 1 n=1 Tax=Tilletiaria anomala (strain ATCC 24038 / CBS 436.72 / UBC 951) TaxID=1037660 RepID=A0A066VZI7_TILAU|nr:mitochondrial Rho GTPase 1 [Tilletiaria anomala UBC 951]KDN47152.1 mitochondrial Rho GTPase 1 [Tilletiaria anomala UBC 951]